MLTYINVADNAFNGSIPPSLFAIPSLQFIRLSFNQLQGQAPEYQNVTSSALQTLGLSCNNLEGSIPRSYFEIRTLQALSLSSNRFTGIVQFTWIQKLQNLDYLVLSYNNVTVDARDTNFSTLSKFPQFSKLKLASCNLRKFPILGNQSRLEVLDLSNNFIDGVIPGWILESSTLQYLDLSNNSCDGVIPRWILESSTLQHLNLSHNNLLGFEIQHIYLPHLESLDIHDNKLHGDIPLISSTLYYVDYSNNLFNGSIPAEFGNYLSSAFFSVSNNSLEGAIPSSICNASNLQVLDLSSNHFSEIPKCLIRNTRLMVLDLKGNKLSGGIPDVFQASCQLQTLDLSNNQLQGKVPKSLDNCTVLEVLDLGNNKMSDVFPCFLRNKSSLSVLILRNNLFHGSMSCRDNLPGSWPKLQVVDLASNNFSGLLNGKLLATWEAMTGGEKESHDHPENMLPSTRNYENSITVINKGLEMVLIKIVLTLFRSIDFSSNNFHGPLPEVIGEFGGLHALNLSHNALTGQIPSVFGCLSNLESLDLSHNKLSGQIPKELASLTFLSVLNLSDNHLVGKIPTDRQFHTFDNTSFEGNPYLCGYPLSKTCNPSHPEATASPDDKSTTRINWDILSKAFGYIFGLGLVMLPAALWPSFRIWYWPKIDSLLLWVFPKLYVKDWNNRLRTRRSQQRSKKAMTS